MKMRTRKPTHFFALFSVCLLVGQLALPSGAQDAAPSVDALFARSLKAIKSVNDYQGEFVKRELIGEELKTE